MSGFYIKGFLAPINCDDCYFNCDCPHDQHIDFYRMTTGRPARCPIVPVGDHGDLIDRNALNEDMGRVCLPDSLGATLGFGAAKQRIDAAPVVVPGDNAMFYMKSDDEPK